MTTPAPVAASPEVKTPATPAPSVEPKVEKKDGTTKKLFPDMVGSTVPGAPQKEVVTPAVTPPVETPAKAETPPVKTEPVKEEILDLEALRGKKIKAIVNGKEELVSGEDALRRLQLDSHLTQESQRLKEKERELAEREKALRKPAEPPKAETPDEESIISDDPIIKKILARQAALEKEVEGHRAIAAKQRYAEGVERLANHVKESLGSDDFRTYLPRIEEWYRGLPPEQQAAADNDQAFLGKYQELKLKDLISGSHAAVAPKAPPPAERPQSAPMTIEGAEGAARIQIDDWDQRMMTALAKAKASGSDEDWAEVIRLKRELPKPS